MGRGMRAGKKAKTPGMGGGNMQKQMMQMQAVQRKMEQVQAEIDEMETTATSGGGAVTVTVCGKKEITAIEIKPEVVDADDVEMLEDLVLTAVNEALKQAEEETSKKMGKLTGGMNIPGLF